jgi:RNA-directed DNA polymerase
MLRSRANTLLSVRRVTEDNAGRKTAGIDRQVITTSVGEVPPLSRSLRRLVRS